jgi:hypothetical protein
MRRAIATIAVIKLATIGLYAGVLRERQLRWGASRTEQDSPLPGDELIPIADMIATRAITIHAEKEQIWPWIAQLGQARGGFYSYDWLENLAGCQISSADRIVPEWQDVSVGDDFRLHPELTLDVARLEPPEALVVAGIAPPQADEDAAAPPYDFTWAFVLSEAGPGSTRLVVRERYAFRSGWAPLVVEPVSLISFVMTQRMLRGIRDRARPLADAD